jgi:dihydrofolate synthase/folylpolyglutamate synthase
MSNRFATYESALAWLTESTDYERMRRVRYNADTFNLDRMQALAAAIGHPERQLRFVHVAGTKGKGSTAAMVEALLRTHGLRTGLFTSPHLVDLRERIQLGRHWIDRDLMRRSTGRVADAVVGPLAELGPTFFELTTAIALAAFVEAAVEVAVMEVGLGGRLDSTNIVTPEVAVITPISLDHIHQLGGTLESIAAEKAGIIKPNVPTVVAPQPAEAMTVIAATAAERHAPLIRVDREVTFDWSPAFDAAGHPTSRVTVRTPHDTYADLALPLAGRVQGANAACAIAAAEVVLGESVSRDKVAASLAGVQWPGRMQTFPGPVTTILDGAHNAASVEQLLAAVGEYYPALPSVVVFASAADKDIDGMMRVLADRRSRVIFTRTNNPRAAAPAELAAALARAGGTTLGTFDDPVAAVHAARNLLPRPAAGQADRATQSLIIICGSLYLVGAVLESPNHFGIAV